MVVLGGGAVSYEQSTPVPVKLTDSTLRPRAGRGRWPSHWTLWDTPHKLIQQLMGYTP